MVRQHNIRQVRRLIKMISNIHDKGYFLKSFYISLRLGVLADGITAVINQDFRLVIMRVLSRVQNGQASVIYSSVSVRIIFCKVQALRRVVELTGYGFVFGCDDSVLIRYQNGAPVTVAKQSSGDLDVAYQHVNHLTR